MFVPEWPSTEEEGLQDPYKEDNNTSAAEFAMNGDHGTCFNENNANGIIADETNAIELTHNEATGVTSVTSDEEEDGMNQCAMWSTSNPEPEDNTAAYTNTNHAVLSSFGGGDIWSTEGFTFESPLKDLLDSNVYSLIDLLEQDELLQELRGCEARLIDYFSKPEVVAGLVECVICEVPYSNEMRGKERWCREEKERRDRAIQKIEGGEQNGDALNQRETQEATILDTSNEIEASWNSPLKFSSSKNGATKETQRTPEEEYDLRFCRYPYMACEVLCSDVGEILNVLINGSVQDITIDDDDDSLLNENTGIDALETKSEEREGAYDNIDVFIDEPVANSSSQQLDPPLTPCNKSQAPNTRILDLLFSVLIDTPPSSLDDRRAGYFEKILVILFRKYPQVMSNYMNTPVIETTKSKNQSERLTNHDPRNSNENGADDMAYVSLMPSMESLANEDGDETTPANLKPVLNTINTQLPLPNVSSPQAPPMLMCALFDHLHSHSIMHIIQRLLLPSLARKQQNTPTTNETDPQGGGSLDSSMNENFMNHISSQMNSAADENHNTTDDEDVEDDAENSMSHLFQCDWSDNPINGLNLLLARLEGEAEQPNLLKYRYPVGYDESLLQTGHGDIISGNEQYELKLSCAHHASEILIGIIQNSSLDSPVMVALASDPFLSRIVGLTSLSKMQTFVPYESATTCAMMVLENLILQLGGYGSASTPAAAMNSGAQPSSLQSPFKDTDVSFSLTELGPHTPVSSPAPVDVNYLFATTASLICHLPTLLEELSMMLVHPETKKWTTPSQYNATQPRLILGIVRIRIVRLLESLVLLGDPVIDLLLQQSDCLECCIDLFWEFEWCSTLHQSIANMLVHVFEAGDHRAGLQDYFIIRCRLLEKLMDSFGDHSSPIDIVNKSQESKTNGVATKFDDELVMTMKNVYANPTTSSVESLDGSESDNSSRERMADIDDNDAVALVSEDDVDSAMEKEEQDSKAMNGSIMTNSLLEATTSEKYTDKEQYISVHDDTKFSFRRGYMGHVIIICQALANASGSISRGGAKNSAPEKTNEKETVHEDVVMLNSSLTADFESSAVHLLSEENITGSKRRLDTSPTRIGEEDISMSPIAKFPASPPEVEHLAQSPLGSKKDLPHLVLILLQHPLAERWSNFVSTTLSAEVSVQSAPLGGQQPPRDSAASVDSGSKNRFVTVQDDSDDVFLGDKGVFGIIDGSIDMNEAEIEIAADIFESLSLNSVNNKCPELVGHNRVTGGILLGNDGGMNSQERNIGNFGSLIQSSSTIESKGYVYDDPLGSVCRFEKDDSSDEEDTTDFSPKAANFESDTGGLNRSSSTEDDDEDMAPVLDLFTGHFAENLTTDTSPPKEVGSNDADIGWANFADFDDAFADDTTATS